METHGTALDPQQVTLTDSNSDFCFEVLVDPHPTVSVIVPTYRRPQTLRMALQSLQSQTLSGFEVLVVDNAADRIVEQTVVVFNRTARIPARYIPEPRLGLHNVRHAGTRAARGDILVFTDDDATFDPGWLEAYSEKFAAHPDMVAAGGPVRPKWEEEPPKWLVEYIGGRKRFGALSLMEPWQDFQLKADGIFYGVNMAIRRQTVFDLGGFNPESFGSTWLGDGETGLNRKIWARKLLVGYVPDALVFHHIPGARMTLNYLRKRASNQGAADAYTILHAQAVGRRWVLQQALKLARCSLRMWLNGLRTRNCTRADTIEAQMQAAMRWTMFTYYVRYVLSRRLRELVHRTAWLESDGHGSELLGDPGASAGAEMLGVTRG